MSASSPATRCRCGGFLGANTSPRWRWFRGSAAAFASHFGHGEWVPAEDERFVIPELPLGTCVIGDIAREVLRSSRWLIHGFGGEGWRPGKGRAVSATALAAVAVVGTAGVRGVEDLPREPRKIGTDS